MNKQWTIIFALLFTLIVAIFAVINVRAVEVDYLFGTAEWPLILVILGSVLMGALIVFSAGIFQVMKLKREIKMRGKKTDPLLNCRLIRTSENQPLRRKKCWKRKKDQNNI